MTEDVLILSDKITSIKPDQDVQEILPEAVDDKSPSGLLVCEYTQEDNGCGEVEKIVEVIKNHTPTTVKKTNNKKPTTYVEPPSLGIFLVRDTAKLPEYMTPGSACFDCYANLENGMVVKFFDALNKVHDITLKADGIVVQPNERVLVPLGFKLDIPKKHMVRLHPRSGLSLKEGVSLVNGEGVVDEDYVDEVMAPIINLSRTPITIKNGDRIVQGEINTYIQCTTRIMRKEPKVKTIRIGGFGSTGK
jgi:dUTP pyrophosphatase